MFIRHRLAKVKFELIFEYMNLLLSLKNNRKINNLFNNKDEIKYTLLLCSLISFFLVLSLKSNIIFHTDTIAPIQQVRLLVDSDNVTLSDIRLARIPSLFPDIAIIYTLIKIFNINDNYTIIAVYAFINCSLLLSGFVFIIDSIFKDKKFFLLTVFIMLSCNIFLVLNDFFYREIFGHFLTPLHQGGNIIMTLYSFLYVLFNIKGNKLNLFNYKINYFSLPIILGLSLVSNKLYLFTFIIPFLVIIIMFYNSKYLLLKTLNFYKIFKDISNKIVYKKLFIFFSIPLFFAVNSIIFFLNTQPMPNISFKIFKTIDGLESIFNRSLFLLIISIIYVILFVSTIYKSYFDHSSRINKSYDLSFSIKTIIKPSINYNDLFIINIFISILGLTPFLYIWFAENVISRYFLINYLFSPLAFSLLFSQNMNNLKRINYQVNRLILPLSLLLFVILFGFLFQKSISYYKGSNYTYSSWPVRNSIKNRIDYNLFNRFNLSSSLRQAALLSKSDFAVDHEQIHSLGLKNGLSDYWGSAVFYIGPHFMKVSPINSTGEPDLWANNKYDYRVNGKDKIINYNFVYTRDHDFARSIINSYGNPDIIYQLQSEIAKPKLINIDQLNESNNNVLIYNENSIGWEKIQKLISK